MNADLLHCICVILALKQINHKWMLSKEAQFKAIFFAISNPEIDSLLLKYYWIM